MIEKEYQNCLLCPRSCGVDRSAGQIGVCGADDQIRVARAVLHFWEEPCISGKSGSGAVFFSGCNLHCLYCQNGSISQGVQVEEEEKKRTRQVLPGKIYSVNKLAETFLDLQQQGANNINLVTAAHYLPGVVEALKLAKDGGLTIPIVYNTSGYETVDSLKKLEGLVDIYLPDYKYRKSDRALRYSHAADYPQRAAQALAEMVRQVGEPVFFTSEKGEDLMKKGVIVRHLLLPGGREDTFAVLQYLHETYGDQIWISIMNQYTPIGTHANHPELDRRIRRREYERVIDYALELGITQAFIQEGSVAKESFIPAFDQSLEWSDPEDGESPAFSGPVTH